MANRGDFQSNFPRQLKRMLAMEEAMGWIDNSQHRGELKSIWLKAHAHHREYYNKRGAQAVGQNISLEEGT